GVVSTGSGIGVYKQKTGDERGGRLGVAERWMRERVARRSQKRCVNMVTNGVYGVHIRTFQLNN
ncbi:hypothetical protein BUY58_12560, partial [Staphylococcus epidermidis]